MGRLMGKPVNFSGQEAPMRLSSDSSRTHQLMGLPAVSEELLIQWTADWIARGGRTLNKPTHFQVARRKVLRNCELRIRIWN